MIKLTPHQSTPQKAADEHLARITDGKSGFVSPKQNLIDWLPSLRGARRNLVRSIIGDFDEIVTCEPKDLRGKMLALGPVSDKRFSEAVVEHMRYESFRKSSRARSLIQSLNLKSCPYCNSQFVVALGRNGKLLCHFDHVYPKSIYPYLCISFFNLVPCCAYCNQLKSAIDPVGRVDFFHPYEASLAEQFKFQATTLAISNFTTNGRTSVGSPNLEIVPNPGVNFDFHRETFLLEELHNEHHDVIDEIYLRSLIYNGSYFQDLKKQLVDQAHLMTEDELKRIIYGTYLDAYDINKRPLTKLTQDLMDQFRRLKSK